MKSRSLTRKWSVALLFVTDFAFDGVGHGSVGQRSLVKFNIFLLHSQVEMCLLFEASLRYRIFAAYRSYPHFQCSRTLKITLLNLPEARLVGSKIAMQGSIWLLRRGPVLRLLADKGRYYNFSLLVARLGVTPKTEVVLLGFKNLTAVCRMEIVVSGPRCAHHLGLHEPRNCGAEKILCFLVIAPLQKDGFTSFSFARMKQNVQSQIVLLLARFQQLLRKRPLNSGQRLGGFSPSFLFLRQILNFRCLLLQIVTSRAHRCLRPLLPFPFHCTPERHIFLIQTLALVLGAFEVVATLPAVLLSNHRKEIFFSFGGQLVDASEVSLKVGLLTYWTILFSFPDLVEDTEQGVDYQSPGPGPSSFSFLKRWEPDLKVDVSVVVVRVNILDPDYKITCLFSCSSCEQKPGPGVVLLYQIFLEELWLKGTTWA